MHLPVKRRKRKVRYDGSAPGVGTWHRRKATDVQSTDEWQLSVDKWYAVVDLRYYGTKRLAKDEKTARNEKISVVFSQFLA